MSQFATRSAHSPLPLREPSVFPVHAGKNIVVSGATGGIGRAIAALLAQQGARVAVLDLDASRAEETAAAIGGDALALAVDIADEEAVGTAFAKIVASFGAVHGLVNCAAIVLHADPLAISRLDWRRQYEVNLFGAYELSRLAALSMIENKIAGAIVSIASEAGKKGHADSLAYSSSKAAMISMTRMLAETLAPHDINVNCVCPGGVATPMLREVSRAYGALVGENADEVFDKLTMAQLGRHIQPVEVARITSFLLSDDAMLIRGQAINADAGDTPC